MMQQHILASSVADADRLLNAVVDEFQHLARQEGCFGILVTRTGAGQFSVELTEKVPYGLTMEAVA